MSRSRAGGLTLRVQRALSRADALHAPKADRLRGWAAAALEEARAEVTLRLVGAEEGQRLNAAYRGKDYATNVLTFVYDADEMFAPEGLADALEGDLVLCVPVVVREALEQRKPLDAHFAHLVVHGMLHLQGYDHEDEAEAVVMEAREREIMAALGFDDPYADDRV